MYDSISNIVVAGKITSAYAASAVSWRSIETTKSSPARVSLQTEVSGQEVRIEAPRMIRERMRYGSPWSTESTSALAWDSPRISLYKGNRSRPMARSGTGRS